MVHIVINHSHQFPGAIQTKYSNLWSSRLHRTCYSILVHYRKCRGTQGWLVPPLRTAASLPAGQDQSGQDNAKGQGSSPRLVLFVADCKRGTKDCFRTGATCEACQVASWSKIIDGCCAQSKQVYHPTPIILPTKH